MYIYMYNTYIHTYICKASYICTYSYGGMARINYLFIPIALSLSLSLFAPVI